MLNILWSSVEDDLMVFNFKRLYLKICITLRSAAVITGHLSGIAQKGLKRTTHIRQTTPATAIYCLLVIF